MGGSGWLDRGGLVLHQGRGPGGWTGPGWAVGHPFAAWGGMVRCDKGFAVGGINQRGRPRRTGFPGSGVMTWTIRAHREDRAAHLAPVAAGAGRQRMW